jgi:ribonuclease T2
MKKNLYLFLAIVAVMLAYLMRKPHTSVAGNQASAPIPQSQPNAAASQQTFDYYLLNLSWSPEFCSTHPDKPECALHLGFVLHGLWPQNTNGSYPENCSNAPGPSDPSHYADLYPDQGLLRHEWQTHGTCSGLAPDAFFQLARQAVHAVAIPTELSSLNHQISMPPAEILSLFAKANPSIPAASLALSCGNNYLTAVEVCLSKTLQPISCGAIRSCHANTVRIPPPQS